MALENETSTAGTSHVSGATVSKPVSPSPPLKGPSSLLADRSAPIDGARDVTALPKELYDDLIREAKERGITVEQAYLEELEAQEELKRITPPIEELLKMARVGGAPEYMRNE